MSAQNPPNRVSLRQMALGEWGALLLFLVAAVLIEILVVLYAISLGVKDETPLQWKFTIPGTGLKTLITVSPLLHLVPIAVVLTLVTSWTYLKRQMTVRPSGAQRARSSNVSRRAKGQKKTLQNRIKSVFSRSKPAGGLGKETRFRRMSLRSALIVFIVFSALLFLISLLAFPRLIYQSVASIYKNDPSLADFAKGAAASIGGVFSSINNALLGAAPGFRDFVLTFGLPISSLATLSNVGRYLVFQNGAAWASTVIVVLYARYSRRSSRQITK
jgi:hypothetical protein